MPAKRETGTAAYTVLRDCGVGAAGEVVQLTEEEAALLVRDGMVAPKEG